jgi:hypothetical protein
MPTANALRTAGFIFTGRVIAIRAGSSLELPEIEFRVDTTLKGTIERGRVIVRAPLTLTPSCDGFPFEPGKPYLVFATSRDQGIGAAYAYGVYYFGGTVALDTLLGRERLREARAMTGRK